MAARLNVLSGLDLRFRKVRSFQQLGIEVCGAPAPFRRAVHGYGSSGRRATLPDSSLFVELNIVLVRMAQNATFV